MQAKKVALETANARLTANGVRPGYRWRLSRDTTYQIVLHRSRRADVTQTAL